MMNFAAALSGRSSSGYRTLVFGRTKARRQPCSRSIFQSDFVSSGATCFAQQRGCTGSVPDRAFSATGTNCTNIDVDLEDSEHCISAAARIAVKRSRLIEEAAADNPFIAAALAGGSVGPAESAIRRYIDLGHMDDLEGKGKPMPNRPPPQRYVNTEEERIQGIINRMQDERPDHLSNGEWKQAVSEAHRHVETNSN